MKNVAVLTKKGAFALFFRPHRGGIWQLKSPHPQEFALPSKAKKMLMPGGQPGGGERGGGVLGG